MKTYICSICGYLYHEVEGSPSDGIAPGTLWKELSSQWVCPLCHAAKSAFHETQAM